MEARDESHASDAAARHGFRADQGEVGIGNAPAITSAPSLVTLVTSLRLRHSRPPQHCAKHILFAVQTAHQFEQLGGEFVALHL